MVIKGISESKLIAVIDKVANNHKSKAFAHFTQDDMKQIVWEIALRKLKDFSIDKSKETNIEKALENWLNKVMSRQLINFYRNNFLVPTQQNKREKNPSKTAACTSLFAPANILNVIKNEDQHCDSLCHKVKQDLEFWDFLISRLDVYQLDTLDSLLSGEDINPYYKSKLLKDIKIIMKEYYCV